MQVNILGGTPQERGLQLEELTKSILERRGYSNLSDRQISSGGHEIDVVGEISIPLMNQTQKIKVVCECKAHSRPIGTTDWLKFLGKVYVEEVNSGNPVNGCFIALSGVNGNVSGSFESLKQKNKANIELITGDSLYTLLIDCFPAIKREKAVNIVNHQTDKRITNISLAYHNSEVFWVMSIESDNFTVLDSNGDVLNTENTIVVLLASILAGEYLDLGKEKQRLEYQKTVESMLFSVLCQHGGCLDESLCLQNVSHKLKESGIELTDSCYEQALATVTLQRFVKKEEGRICLSLREKGNKVLFFRYILSIGISVDLLASDFFVNLINTDLLNEIETVQCGICIPDNEKEVCLKVLRSSPSALFLAVNEINMITNHRKNQPGAVDQFDKHDIQLFIRLICEKLQTDYDNPNLKQFYFSNAEIVELDFEFSLKVKNKNGIYFEHCNRVRNGIAQAAESIGGGLIQILAINDAPEPWER